jgi:preprotein translocase subunit Sss1
MITFAESLVTSSKETIKNVLREIYREFKVTITAKSDRYSLILKVNGYKEYFKGN